jgi:hypothetical protein
MFLENETNEFEPTHMAAEMHLFDINPEWQAGMAERQDVDRIRGVGS